MTTSEALFDRVLLDRAIFIWCPSCHRSYRLSAEAVPAAGRDVHCDACGYQWFATADVTDPARLADPEVDDTVLQAVFEEMAALTPSSSVECMDRLADPVATHTIDEPGGLHADSAVPSQDYRNASVSGWQWLVLSILRIRRGAAQAGSVVGRTLASVPERGRSLVFSVRALATRPVPRPFLAPRPRRLGTALRGNHLSGDEAAKAFRARIRARERNRLTPVRLFGWGIWAGAAAGVAFVVTDKETAVAVFPRAANVYAHFESGASPSGLELSTLKRRLAMSPGGPVLEVRGIVANRGNAAILPGLTILSKDGTPLGDMKAVPLSPVPLPRGGERPFVLRANIPEGAVTASLHLAEAVAEKGSSFRVQQVGSGWGGATPADLATRVRY